MIFPERHLCRPEIRDGRGHQHHRGLLEVTEHRLGHLLGGSNALEPGDRRRFRTRWAADQQNARAAAAADLRQRVTHLSGRAVADVANRIERLFGGTGRHQNRFPFQILTQAQGFENRLRNALGRSEAAGAGHAAGQVTLVGIDHPHAAVPQRLQVLLSGRVLPHVDVHGRRDDEWSLGGQAKRSEEIVSDAVSHLGQHVGRGGGDHEGVDRLCHRDVLDGALDDWRNPGPRRTCR